MHGPVTSKRGAARTGVALAPTPSAFVSEPRGGVPGPLERLAGGVSGGTEVPHLAARPRLALAIQKEARLGDGQRCREVRRATLGPEVAEQVHDRGRSAGLDGTEGQVAHRPHELLELARWQPH